MITASFDTLVRQASDTVSEYLCGAISNIDNAFGEGYAKGHPELVAAFIQAAASDFNTACMAKVLGYSLNQIAESIDRIPDGK